MKRMLLGTLIFAIIYGPFSSRSWPACVLTGVLATFLLLQFGSRSIVEKIGVLLSAAAIAWLAGPRAATTQSPLAHFAGWTLAATALAVYLHPRAE